MLNEPVHSFYNPLPSLSEIDYTQRWIVVKYMAHTFHDLHIRACGLLS